MEEAVELLNSKVFNRQTKPYRDAVALLEKAAEGDQRGNEEIHLALANNEMRKFGSRDDKNFDAKYVLWHLQQSGSNEKPVSSALYHSRAMAFRRLERTQDYLENCRTYVKDKPDRFSMLVQANIAINRRDDNRALADQECERLEKQFETHPALSAPTSFQNRLNYLAQCTHDPELVIKIYESIKQRNQSVLPRNLQRDYGNLIFRIENQTTHSDEGWLRLENALNDQNFDEFHTLMNNQRNRLRVHELPLDQILEFFHKAEQLGLTDGSSASIVRFLERVMHDKERHYTSLFWATRRGQKNRLQKMLGKFSMQANKYGDALKHLEAVLDDVSEDDETRKLVEKCREKIKNEPKPRRRR